MLKNQHLLGAIAILGLVSVVLCLQSVFTERTISTGLAKLSNDSDTTTLRLQTSVNDLSERLKQTDKNIGDLIQELKDHKQKNSEVESAHVLSVNQMKLEWENRTKGLETLLANMQQDMEKLTKGMAKIASEKKDKALPGGPK